MRFCKSPILVGFSNCAFFLYNQFHHLCFDHLNSHLFGEDYKLRTAVKHGNENDYEILIR